MKGSDARHQALLEQLGLGAHFPLASLFGLAVGAIAVFSRSRSALRSPVKFSPGTPVSSTATRSSRPVVGVSGSVGYRKFTRPASSGLVYRFRNCESFRGADPFQRSFCPMGITTSLISGFPSRETCTQSPRESVLPLPRRTLISRRLVLA